jgi:hypothetical protein
MITFIIATIAILLYAAVALYTFRAEREHPIDDRIVDTYMWYLPM